jgi:hypothetical protein
VTSGLAPASFGILIDRGVTIEAIALASLLVLVIGTILAGLAIRGAAPPVADGKSIPPTQSKQTIL